MSSSQGGKDREERVGEPKARLSGLAEHITVALLNTEPMVRSEHIERICRVHIAREIEAANRAARFGITAAQAAQIARGQEPTWLPTRPRRGA